jgi:hypothetical protein
LYLYRIKSLSFRSIPTTTKRKTKRKKEKKKNNIYVGRYRLVEREERWQRNQEKYTQEPVDFPGLNGCLSTPFF